MVNKHTIHGYFKHTLYGYFKHTLYGSFKDTIKIILFKWLFNMLHLIFLKDTFNSMYIKVSLYEVS